MNRAPDQFAPSWLPRQQRRHVDRALRKLLHRGVCSLCGGSFKHNSPTASGFDAQGIVAVAGECCFDRLTQVFGIGLYSDRQYDFLSPDDRGPELPPERIVEAFAAYSKSIADTDSLLAVVERRGGGVCPSRVYLRDYPWKSDDRDWFKRNPERTHRVRSPFPNEVEIETPTGYVPLILVRQVEPRSRLRAAVDLKANLLPLPDDEAIAHALFETAVRREFVPPDSKALLALAEKHTAHRKSSQ